jgi:hypothetical protein
MTRCSIVTPGTGLVVHRCGTCRAPRAGCSAPPRDGAPHVGDRAARRAHLLARDLDGPSSRRTASRTPAARDRRAPHVATMRATAARPRSAPAAIEQRRIAALVVLAMIRIHQSQITSRSC